MDYRERQRWVLEDTISLMNSLTVNLTRQYVRMGKCSRRAFEDPMCAVYEQMLSNCDIIKKKCKTRHDEITKAMEGDNAIPVSPPIMTSVPPIDGDDGPKAS